MISSQDEEVFWILDLVGQEQADSLQRLLATIDVVSEEEVVCFWWEATVLEQSKQIIVLPVNVATNLEVVSVLAHPLCPNAGSP